MEPSGQRLCDVAAVVQPTRRYRERRGDQIQRGAADVQRTDAACGRPAILVSTASEEEWFDNIVELGWQLYLCSVAALSAAVRLGPADAPLYRSGVRRPDRRGPCGARQPRAGAASRCVGRGRPRSRMRIRNTGRNCWARSAGAVRPPLLDLTEEERRAPLRRAFEACGLAERSESARPAARTPMSTH